MGWASGAELADEIWDAVKDHIPSGERMSVAERLIGIFEGRDCDTMMGTGPWEEVYEFCTECDDGFEDDDEYCKACGGKEYVPRKRA